MSKEFNFPFETIINYIDNCKHWGDIWNTFLKSYIDLLSCPIGFNQNTLSRNIENLRLAMYDLELGKDPLFTLYIMTISSKGDLASKDKKAFKESFKPSYFPVVLFPLQGSSVNDLKKGQKSIDKLKSELELQELSWLPLLKDMTSLGKGAVDNFSVLFTQRLSIEFNKEFSQSHKAYEKGLEDKTKYTDEDKFYFFLTAKLNFMNYLVLASFWKELQRMCCDDLFKQFKCISHPFAFNETFNIFRLDHQGLKTKIENKTLSNLEIIKVFCFYYIQACEYLNDSIKLIDFFLKMIEEIPSFNNSFDSLFHYYFWFYQLTKSLLLRMKLITQNDYIDYDKAIHFQGQLTLLNHMKKIMKNYSLATKSEIPNEKIFQLAIQHNKDYISSELTNSFNAINEDIEGDSQYQQFKEDLRENTNVKLVKIFFEQKCFLEEYMSLIENMDKLNLELNQHNVSLKNNIELLPLYFALSKFDTIKTIIVSLMERLKSLSCWDYIYQYLNFLLIILLNCLEKNEENLLKLLKCVDIKMNQIANLIKKIGSDDLNIICNIISRYIESFDVLKEESNYAVFYLGTILTADFKSSNITPNLFFNITTTSAMSKEIDIELKNPSGFKFTIEKVIFCFEDIYSKEKVKYISNAYIKEIAPFSVNSNSKLILSNKENIFKVNHRYLLKEILFITPNHIQGIYNVKENESFILNIHTIDLEVNSVLKHNYSLNQPLSVIGERDREFYYNVVSSLYISLKNIPDMKDKSLHIAIEDIKGNQESKAEVKIIPTLFSIKNDIDCTNTSIDFIEGKHSYNKDTVLCIPFIVEDSEYFYSQERIFHIHTIVKQNNNEIFSFTQTLKGNYNHLFYLSHSFRVIKNNTYLMQSSISLNIEQQGITLSLEKNSIVLASNYAINTVHYLPENIMRIHNQLRTKPINFSINNKKSFIFIYPENSIKEQLEVFASMPYHIKIGANFDKKKLKVFEEFTLSVLIKKLIENESLMMVKMKENENWCIIGKSKVIEKMMKGKGSYEVQFKLFPLTEGYLKLPEIEFMEYTLEDKTQDQIKNVNQLEFNLIVSPTVIEGNERIVKIESVNSCTLRLNII